jgi:hypothetical protein
MSREGSKAEASTAENESEWALTVGKASYRAKRKSGDQILPILVPIVSRFISPIVSRENRGELYLR